MCGAFLFTQTQQKAGASHKGKATTFTVADPKFMLDICAKLWYNAFCNCGYSTSASISAFQAEEVGSIPIARSMQKKALSSPELGAFLHIWGKMFGVHLLFTKKIVDIVHTTYYIKGKGA